MKKLLFIVSLMMLGANAFAVTDPTAGPAKGDSVTADVLVQAEITADSFTITDVFGKPLVLDFGKLAQDQDTAGKVWTAEVEYKITATKAPTNNTKFLLSLGDKEVILKHVNNNLTQNNTLTATVALDKDTKIMKANTEVVTGLISGSIKENLKDKATGMYKETTQLTATVQ